MNLITVNKKLLKESKAINYKENDVIKCEKYYIHIKYGIYDCPLCTYVNTEDSMIELKMSKWPLYIRNFIEAR